MAAPMLLLFISLSSLHIVFAAEINPINATSDEFEYLLLAQFWPSTSCYFYFGQEECSSVPKNVTGWTIHGLWPSRPGSLGPQYCNNSLKFNFAEIASLRPQLEEYWPYLDLKGDFTELWNHEWTKHGTCAQTIPALRGEMGYFPMVMKLQRPLNVLGVLKKFNITPSYKSKYKPQDIFNALQSVFGTKTVISCMYDKKSKTHQLDQVWICFTKSFDLRDCPEAAAMAAAKLTDQRRSRIPRGKFGLEVNYRSHYHSYYVDCPSPSESALYYAPLSPPAF